MHIVLSGARREILKTAGRLAGVGCVMAAFGPGQAWAQRKIAKNEARYQEHPNGSQHCAVCAYYVPPIACQLVRGEVSPNGWCDQFQRKAG